MKKSTIKKTAKKTIVATEKRNRTKSVLFSVSQVRARDIELANGIQLFTKAGKVVGELVQPSPDQPQGRKVTVLIDKTKKGYSVRYENPRTVFIELVPSTSKA